MLVLLLLPPVPSPLLPVLLLLSGVLLLLLLVLVLAIAPHVRVVAIGVVDDVVAGSGCCRALSCWCDVVRIANVVLSSVVVVAVPGCCFC